MGGGAFTILPPTAPDAAIRNLILQPAADHLAISVQLAVITPPPPPPPHTTPAVFNGGAEPARTNPNRTFTPILARVTIKRDNTTLLDQPIEFQTSPIPNTQYPIPTLRWLTLRDPSPPSPPTSPARYSAHIQLPRDPWPENDQASAIWPGPMDRRILIVGASQPPDLPGTFLPTDRFPTDPAQLAAQAWQTIILHDVPAETLSGADALVGRPNGTPPLSPAAAHALDRAVRHNGTGLLILAHSHAFGPGRYGEGSLPGDLLDNLSPLASHPLRSAGTRVLFLLDASSSMNELAPPLPSAPATERKFPILSRSLQQAAAYLASEDEVTLITFNNTANRLASAPAATLRPQLAQLLASVQPSGGTNPDATLPLVAEFMQKSGRHLIVLLTDGEIPQMDIPRWQTLLNAPDTHLAIIAPAPQTSAPGTQNFLSRLAAAVPQSSWSHAPNPSAWTAALRNALLDQFRGTVHSTPLPWRTADNTLSATAPAWTQTWLKPESTLVASSTQDSSLGTQDSSIPVAALAQRGLGKVAALAIADDASPAYRTLRQRLLDAVAAAPGDPRFSAAAHLTDAGWRITVDALDADTFLNSQNLSLTTLNSTTPIPLTQTAPGHYEALIPPTHAPEGLAAIITRQPAPVPPVPSPASPSATDHWPLTTDHSSLVARLQTPALQTTEYPATVQHTAALPPGTILLPPHDSTLWSPPAAQLPLTPYLWFLAAALALTALWTRK